MANLNFFDGDGPACTCGTNVNVSVTPEQTGLLITCPHCRQPKAYPANFGERLNFHLLLKLAGEIENLKKGETP